MKQYLKSIVNDLKQFSNTLDKKSLLLNKPWALIDSDLGIQKIIFKSDKEMVLSRDGNATKGKWEYLSEAKSLLLDRGADIILCKEEYIDESVLILRKDGTKDGYIILANENNLPSLDAYRYLTELSFQKSGTMYIELNDKRFISVKRNYYEQIGTGSEVKIDGQSINDGEYESKGGMKTYVIINGKISRIINFSLLEGENGEKYLTDTTTTTGLRTGDRIFQKNKTIVDEGTFTITREKIKMRIKITEGKICEIQYIKEYKLNSNDTCKLYCQNYYKIEKGDVVLINDIPAIKSKFEIDEFKIKASDGLVKNVVDLKAQIVSYGLLIFMFFLVAITIITVIYEKKIN